jgi:hypothetical protein
MGKEGDIGIKRGRDILADENFMSTHLRLWLWAGKENKKAHKQESPACGLWSPLGKNSLRSMPEENYQSYNTNCKKCYSPTYRPSFTRDRY